MLLLFSNKPGCVAGKDFICNAPSEEMPYFVEIWRSPASSFFSKREMAVSPRT